MTTDHCTNLVHLGKRRYQKAQEEVWNELAEAIASLKDSERHLLKAQIAMENAKWDPNKVEEMRTWALECQKAEEGSYFFFKLLCSLMNYEDPFDSSG